MRIKNALVFFFVLIAFCAFSQNKNEKNTFKINSEKSLSNKLEIQFNLNDYSKKIVTTPKGDAIKFIAENSSEIQLKGAPGLPKFAQSIIVGENTDVKVLVKDSKYIEIENILIAPSKGVISRDKNPSDIPFEYGEYYSKNAMYPGNLVEIGDKYILRDFTGRTISVFPFQYNPVTKVLRVYTDIVIELTDEKGAFNYQQKNLKTVNSEYNEIYEHHFLNYSSTKYTAQEEEGNMLVVCHTNYLDEMQSFVDWKNQRGLKTEMVEFSTIGTTATQLKSYIENYYNNDGLTYLLLVGDSEHIPSLSKSGDSDAAYGHIEGDDSYAEVFVGRFSAQSDADVLTQVQRTIYYEKETSIDATWLSKAIGIASAEGGKGQGDDGESDIQHMDNIRTDLLSYGYSPVEQIYDPGASATTLATKIDGGVGLIDYIGHGADTYWVTTGFSTSNVGNLTNENMLPFIFDVACVNGNFHNQTCFAESWLRASKNSNPTGAIAIIASTINQSWSPPMDGQDEMIDILIDSYTNNIKRTFGGITVNGIMHMIDEYGNDGSEMADTWTIFGDPSLLVRTKTPTGLVITAVPDQIIGTNSIVVTGDNDAFVSLTKENVIIATGKIEGGTVTLEFDNLIDLTPLTLTATAFNKVTYIDEINVIPTTPYVIKDNVIVNDATENNNGTLEYGETANLNVQLKNVSETFDAFEVNAELMTTDTNLQITDSDETYGTIEKDTVSLIDDAFQVEVETDIVDQTQVELTLQVTGKDISDNPYTWNSKVYFTLNAPKIEIGELIVDDSSGDNDGILDPGETAILKLEVENTGHASISGLTGLLEYVSGSTHFNIIDGTAEAFSIGAGLTEIIEFNVSVAAEEVVGTPVQLKFSIIDNDYSFYSVNENNSITIGEIPEYVISDGGTHTVNVNSLFYDSGGKLSNYLNDENYTITFLPKATNETLRVNFNSFSVEPDGSDCYDILSVYNGETTSAPKIGDYCSANSPTEIIATSTSGALTFEFVSDDYIDDIGWEAEITNIKTYAVTFNVTDNSTTSPLQNVKVIFNSSTLYTDVSGVAVFTKVLPKTDMAYVVSKSGYVSITDTIDVNNEDKTINLSLSVITAVDDIRFEDLMVYPNPSQGNINIDFGNLKGDLQINVYDIIGKSIYNKLVHVSNKNIETIDLTNQAKGIYFITLKTNTGEKVSKKVIIK